MRCEHKHVKWAIAGMVCVFALLIGNELYIDFKRVETPTAATAEAFEENSGTVSTHLGCLTNITFSDFSDIHMLYMTDERRSIMLHSPDRRHAKIDFSGEEVTFTGDLPVGFAAKIFFETVFEIHRSKRGER